MSVRLSDHVVWRDADGAVIVLDTRSSLYLTIGGTGPLLWPLIVAGTTPDELAQRLVETFEIDVEVAAGDVDRFLAGLREHDLVTA